MANVAWSVFGNSRQMNSSASSKTNPATAYSLHTSDDGTHPDGTPFDSTFGNSAVQNVTSPGGEIIRIGSPPLAHDTYFDLSNDTIILKKNSDSDGDATTLQVRSRGIIQVASDTVGTVVFNDIPHATNDETIDLFESGSVCDVGAGGRLRYEFPMIPTSSSGIESAGRNNFGITLDTADSEIRMTFATGPYAMSRAAWDDRVSSAVKTAGGKFLGSCVFDYNVNSNVTVRDILFQGGYVDFRPSGVFAAPNAGGFEALSGVKILSNAFGSTTEAAPLVWGSPDNDFTISIEETNRASSGLGYFEYAYQSNATLTFRSVFNNFNGIDWGDKLAVYPGGGDNNCSRLENHVFPGITVQSPTGVKIEGCQIVYNSRFPDYTVEANTGTSITFPAANAATYTGYTNSDGFARLGNPNSSRGATDNGIILEAFTRFEGSGSNVDSNYGNADAASAAYASYDSHTYGIYRFGDEIVHNSTSFEKAPVAGGGKPEIGTITLPPEDSLTTVVSEQNITTTTENQATFTITDTTANSARLTYNGQSYTVTSVSNGTVNISGSNIPSGGTVEILSFAFPANAANTDDLFDLLYADSITENRGYDFNASSTKAGYLKSNFANVRFDASNTFSRSVSPANQINLSLGTNTGCPVAGTTFLGLETDGGFVFDGVITCGVDAGQGVNFQGDSVFVNNRLIDTDEDIVSGSTGMTLASGSFRFRDADCSGLTVNGPSTGTALIILEGTAVAPTIGTGNVSIVKGSGVTYTGIDGTYDSTKGNIAIWSEDTDGTFTQVTDFTTDTSVSGQVRFDATIGASDTLHYAFAYDEFEFEYDSGDNITVALSEIPSIFIDFNVALSTDEQALLTGTSTGSTSITFTLPTNGIDVPDLNARLILRRFKEKANTLNQIAQGKIDKDFITFDAVGLVVPDFTKIEVSKSANANEILRLLTQAIGVDGTDRSTFITTTSPATEVRFNAKANNVFTDLGVFQAVSDEFADNNQIQHNNLQTNLKGYIKTYRV